MRLRSRSAGVAHGNFSSDSLQSGGGGFSLCFGQDMEQDKCLEQAMVLAADSSDSLIAVVSSAASAKPGCAIGIVRTKITCNLHRD